MHVGFIGTSQAVERAQKFYEECADGVDGDDEHAPFPGCKPDRGYRCQLRFSSKIVEPITRQEQTKMRRRSRATPIADTHRIIIGEFVEKLPGGSARVLRHIAAVYGQRAAASYRAGAMNSRRLATVAGT